MADRLFSDARLAALYDLLYPAEQRDDLRFYLPLAISPAQAGTGRRSAVAV
ncbi:hypothetical protein ABZ746_08670 [Streptomyces sp. NPDC020096]